MMRIIARLNIGGPALHATLLAESLAPDRYDSMLVCGDVEVDEGSYLDLHERRDLRCVRVATLGRQIRGLRDLSALSQLVRLMRKFNPDIVHTHTAKAGTLGRLAARLAGVPVVVHTYHGHVFHGYFSKSATRVFLAVERLLARLSTRLLTVSPTVRKELLGLGIGTPEQLIVMPLGLDLERFRQSDGLRGQLRAELGFDPDTPLVGIVARLAPIKSHETFLTAAALIAARNARTRFVIVGDGERRGPLETLSRSLGLEDRVVFLGWRRDLDRIYADLDVVALTSQNEGSPVSLIEAMAARCAVVSTRVGGVPDLIQHRIDGLLVPPANAEALADAMGELLADAALRHSLGSAAAAKAYPAYSATRLLDDMDRLYSSLLTANVTRT